MEYIETDCVFEHEGREFESGGAVVTSERIIAYLGKEGVLTDWHGNPLGTYRITSKWWVSGHTEMCQVWGRVDGVEYQGRSQGEGMVFTGRRARE